MFVVLFCEVAESQNSRCAFSLLFPKKRHTRFPPAMSDEMEIDSADWQVPNTLNITPGGPASSAVAGSSNAAPAAASSSSTTTNNTNNAAGPSTSSAAAAVQPPVTTPVAKTTPMDSVLANLGTPSTGASVLAPTTIVPSVTVSLHPLVILHLSEHWTRIRAQEGQKQQGKCCRCDIAHEESCKNNARPSPLTFCSYRSAYWQTEWPQHWSDERIRAEIRSHPGGYHHQSGVLRDQGGSM